MQCDKKLFWQSLFDLSELYSVSMIISWQNGSSWSLSSRQRLWRRSWSPFGNPPFLLLLRSQVWQVNFFKILSLITLILERNRMLYCQREASMPQGWCSLMWRRRMPARPSLSRSLTPSAWAFSAGGRCPPTIPAWGKLQKTRSLWLLKCSLQPRMHVRRRR